jgi:hypothetical protein
MMSDEQKAERHARDKVVVLSPEGWVNHPVLPLKSTKETKAGGFPVVGVLVDGLGLAVYHANMFALDGVPLDAAWAESTPHTTYSTVDALLEEWEVD